jgi:hypothetical protein
MAMFYGTEIRYNRLLFHLVGGNLAGYVEEGRRFVWLSLPWSGESRPVYVRDRLGVTSFGSIKGSVATT